MKKHFFTTIGNSKESQVIPADKEHWRNMRRQAWLKQMCDNILNGHDELKAKLPVWTPRCAEFNGNRRREEDALKPLQRIMFDIDEKGHTDEIMARCTIADGKASIGEFNILLIEESARKGTHILCDLPVGMTPKEAQQRFCELVGMPVDTSVKNVAGCIFMVSEDHERFVSEDLFEAVVPQVDAATTNIAKEDVSKATEPESVSSVSGVSPKLRNSAEPSYEGFSYKEIIDKYWELFNEGKVPNEGNRNTLTFELACTIRNICGFNREAMLTIIPRYNGLPEAEWIQVIDNALKEPRKGMPMRLSQVMRELKKQRRIAIATSCKTGPKRPHRLPKLLSLLSSNVPEMYKSAVCDAVFPALGLHLHDVRFRYWDNVEREPAFMNVLIAPMSVGKSCIIEPIEHIIKDIRERDKESERRENAWKMKCKSDAKNKKAIDPRPTDLVQQVLKTNVSDAAFTQMLIDSDANGKHCLYSRVNEIHFLTKLTSRGSRKEVMELIKIAYDRDIYGANRVGADSVSGSATCRLNFNASTTIDEGVGFLKSGLNDGTVSRLNITTIHKPELNGPRTVKDLPIMGIYTEEFDKALKPYLDNLKAASGLIECPEAVRLAKQLTIEQEETADMMDSEPYRVLSYRANVIAYHKAMLLYIANGCKWTKEIADYQRWTLKHDLWCKMLFFNDLLLQKISNEIKIARGGAPNLIDELPNYFSLEEYQSVRERLGLEGKGDGTLRTWKYRDLITVDEFGKYMKTEKALKLMGVA